VNFAPWVLQALLAPISIVFSFSTFGKENADTTVTILVGLASFSAVFASLSLAAFSAKLHHELNAYFRSAGIQFLQATLFAAMAVVFNFGKTWVEAKGWPSGLDYYLSLGSGLSCGAGVITAHCAIWWYSKAVFKTF